MGKHLVFDIDVRGAANIKKIYEVMQKDSAFIMSKDALSLTKQKKKEYKVGYNYNYAFNGSINIASKIDFTDEEEKKV